MGKKTNDINKSVDQSVNDGNSTEQLSSDQRRKAVRNILAGSSLTVGAVTSGKWAKPVVDAVIVPAHAQTSITTVLTGNANVSPVTTAPVPQDGNGILDFFIGSAHAGVAPADPSLAGACLTMTITGTTSFSLVVEFADSSMTTVMGTISGTSLSGSSGGITVTGSVDLAAAMPTAMGTVGNGSGTFGFTLDTTSGSCTPVTTTPAPTTAPPPTTTTATPTTTTTATPTTTTTATPTTTTTTITPM